VKIWGPSLILITLGGKSRPVGCWRPEVTVMSSVYDSAQPRVLSQATLHPSFFREESRVSNISPQALSTKPKPRCDCLCSVDLKVKCVHFHVCVCISRGAWGFKSNNSSAPQLRTYHQY
jgi:hypothetical protein